MNNEKNTTQSELLKLFDPKSRKKYFIVLNDNKEGPFTLCELIEMQLPKNTLVWAKGFKEWIEIGTIKTYNRNIPPSIPTKEKSIDTEIEIPKKKEIVVISSDNNNSNSNINNFNRYAPNSEILALEKEISEDLNTKITQSQSTDSKKSSPKTKIKKKSEFNPKHAGFWIRCLSFIIDHLFTFSLFSLIWIGMSLPIPEDATIYYSGNITIMGSSILTILAWIYYAIFESSKTQATPGKIITGLKVTSINYTSISFGHATGRYFSKYFSFLTLGVGFLMAAFNKNKQTLHDKIMMTYVIKDPDKNNRLKVTYVIALAIMILSLTAYLIIMSPYINSKSSLNNSYPTKYHTLETESAPKMKQFSYKGLSIKYNDHWDVTGKTYGENNTFQIMMGNNNSTGYRGIIITWVNDVISLNEHLNWSYTLLYENQLYENVSIFDEHDSRFNIYESQCADFLYHMNNEIHLGKIVVFNGKDKTFLIFFLSDTRDEIENDFKLIENDFTIIY